MLQDDILVFSAAENKPYYHFPYNLNGFHKRKPFPNYIVRNWDNLFYKSYIWRHNIDIGILSIDKIPWDVLSFYRSIYIMRSEEGKRRYVSVSIDNR